MTGPDAAGAAPPTLLLPDAETLADLSTFVGRARRVDPDGAARLVAAGTVLAAYVSPLHGGGGPTVLGLRVLALAAPAALDATVPLAALLDRFARAGSASALPVPPTGAAATWAGVTPPRAGWDAEGLLDPAALRERAHDGVREVAAGVPQGAGAQAVARLRAQVWGRPLAPDLPDVPAGVAFAADALGFLDDGEPVALHRTGPWVRATTRRGHVLARRSALL
ncbi:MAG TPA: hypothetical protein VE781_16525 [Kineosporiaceae bacterium]|nr:hypothetical protein [Kineosporiaceae bacterium]